MQKLSVYDLEVLLHHLQALHDVVGRAALQGLLEEPAEGAEAELVHDVHFVQLPDHDEELTADRRERAVHLPLLVQVLLQALRPDPTSSPRALKFQ